MKILSWLSGFRNPQQESLGKIFNINSQLIVARHVVSVSIEGSKIQFNMQGGHFHTYTFDDQNGAEMLWQKIKEAMLEG